MLERGGGGDAEAQMFGGRGHRGYHQQWIVHRYLRTGAQRRLGAAGVHVVDAEDIGDEQAVEQAPFQQLRQVGPILQVLVPRRLRFGMPPGAGNDVGHTVHVECVEDDLAGHGWPPVTGSDWAAGRLASNSRV